MQISRIEGRFHAMTESPVFLLAGHIAIAANAGICY